MLDKIKEILETEINPMLALHNGSCEAVSFKDGVLEIELLGGCSGCPSSHLTLFNAVVPILREQVPEIIEIQLIRTLQTSDLP